MPCAGKKKRDKTKVKTHFKTKVKTELKRFSEYWLVKTELKQAQNTAPGWRAAMWIKCLAERQRSLNSICFCLQKVCIIFEVWFISFWRHLWRITPSSRRCLVQWPSMWRWSRSCLARSGSTISWRCLRWSRSCRVRETTTRLSRWVMHAGKIMIIISDP